MRLLILDSRNSRFYLHHSTKVAEEITPDDKERSYEKSLVVFVAIEKQDLEKSVTAAAKDIRKIARKNKVPLVIINPFAHLSNNLASPDIAIDLLNKLLEKVDTSEDFETVRCVFGWYKEFTIDVLGHENSQIYREY